MKTIKEIQDEVKDWAYHNFGNQPSLHPLLGIGEETGELQHHFLKREQKIRTNEDHDEKIKDALADLFIFMCDFSNCEDIDLEAVINGVWDNVKQRNWKTNKENGQSPQ